MYLVHSSAPTCHRRRMHCRGGRRCGPSSSWKATSCGPSSSWKGASCGPSSSWKAASGKSDDQNVNCTKSKTETPASWVRNSHVSELGDHFLLSIDLPGVKTQDANVSEENYVLSVNAERKSGDEVIAKFHRTFRLDKQRVEPEGTKAYMSDGVLYAKVPKKPASGTFVFIPTLAEPPVESSKNFRFQLELPGVKPDNLEVSLVGDRLSIVAERWVGSAYSRVSRSLSVQEQGIDVSHLEAYLDCGILTIVAPKKEAESSPVRVIPVVAGSPFEEEIEKKPTEENNQLVVEAVAVEQGAQVSTTVDKKEDDIVVETVTEAEADEEDEFEVPPLENVAPSDNDNDNNNNEEEDEFEIPPESEAVKADAEGETEQEDHEFEDYQLIV